MENKEKIANLRIIIERLYKANKKKLLFHGLHHVLFVRNKAVEFGKNIKADLFLVESAALVHDLNYLVKKNSSPEEGEELRVKILKKVGYSIEEIGRIEKIIIETHTANRTEVVSKEGMALSDGDSLFKILPITPVIFSSKFIEENEIDLKKLAKKISDEQNGLLKRGIYFYTASAKKKYLKWARSNLNLWNDISEALKDEDIVRLIQKN